MLSSFTIFQLTPSRRATCLLFFLGLCHIYFNSRPHGGRLTLRHRIHLPFYFNSRPHGGRPIFHIANITPVNFNSRPHGGRHRCIRKFRYENIISTHALTEGDAVRILHLPVPSYFNSRPHGGRLMPLPTRSTPVKFQLTPSRRATSRSGLSDQDHSFQLTPSRRATLATVRTVILCFISTHALTEGDNSMLLKKRG